MLDQLLYISVFTYRPITNNDVIFTSIKMAKHQLKIDDILIGQKVRKVDPSASANAIATAEG